MARSTGAMPSCGTEGVKRYAWNTEQTCIMSCKKPVALCVEPEITNIKPFSFVGVNADGIAVQLTKDNMQEVMSSEIYFSLDSYKPREPGKQRYFYREITVNGNCVCFKETGFTTQEDIAHISRVALRNGIVIKWPHVN